MKDHHEFTGFLMGQTRLCATVIVTGVLPTQCTAWSFDCISAIPE
jgi:hypothetical protein